MSWVPFVLYTIIGNSPTMPRIWDSCGRCRASWCSPSWVAEVQVTDRTASSPPVNQTHCMAPLPVGGKWRWVEHIKVRPHMGWREQMLSEWRKMKDTFFHCIHHKLTYELHLRWLMTACHPCLSLVEYVFFLKVFGWLLLALILY